jgi:hypothetical protein
VHFFAEFLPKRAQAGIDGCSASQDEAGNKTEKRIVDFAAVKL